MTERQADWTNITVITAAHLLAVAGALYLVFVRCSWWTVGLGGLWLGLTGLAITGGYHRLYAHRAYKAAWGLRAFYLLFGAAAVQNSALKWSADHRVHHRHTDGDMDPYNIRRGFWWAHLGWVLNKAPQAHGEATPDLAADPLVAFQHRYYVALAILFGALLPMAVGLAWGDPLGALLVAGFLRLVVLWHATFSINSVAHCIGSQPYSVATSARDSIWTALISLGEGYHNFHHRFQGDYRNGVRWYHFDPTKWFVWTMSRVGLTRDLRRTSADVIRRARASAR